ncbi:MAG: FUSC family protein [Acidimicrobiia bacterium]
MSANHVRQALVAGVQTGLAAGIAWWLAAAVLPTDAPSYAPVAAVAVLGGGYDRLPERVRSMLGGMAIAIVLSEIAVRFLPSGVTWIAVVTAVAIVVTRLLLDDTLAVVYAGFNTPILFALGGDGWLPERGIEALIGAGTAFGLVYLVFPPRAIRYARRAIDRQVAAAVNSLRLTSAALDPAGSNAPLEADERSESIDRNSSAVNESFGFSFEVARFSPWRRHQRRAVESAWERERRLQPFLRTTTTAARAANRLAEDGPDAHLSKALDMAADLVATVGEVASLGESGQSVEAEERVRNAAREVGAHASSHCGNEQSLHMAVTELVHLVAGDARRLVRELLQDGGDSPRRPVIPASADEADDARRD